MDDPSLASSRELTVAIDWIIGFPQVGRRRDGAESLRQSNSLGFSAQFQTETAKKRGLEGFRLPSHGLWRPATALARRH